MAKKRQNQPVFHIKHQKFTLKRKNLLHETIKYGKIFYVFSVSKGTPFDTPKSFQSLYSIWNYPLVLIAFHAVSDKKLICSFGIFPELPLF